MGYQGFNTIVTRIEKSKYYSMSSDSTPNEGQVDQLTVIFHFIKGSKPVERFLKFLPYEGQKITLV